MNKYLPSRFDQEVKNVAEAEGFDMIKGYVDLKKNYARSDLYGDKMRRLVFLCQYGIFEPGRDAWLRDTESEFLLSQGWKYDTEETKSNLTVKEKKDISHESDVGGVWSNQRRQDKPQGRKKVGFVRHHFVRKKEDFCRSLKIIGWSAHGEAITKKRPKKDSVYGYLKKDYLFHAKNFGKGMNGYILTPKPENGKSSVVVPPCLPQSFVGMMQGIGEEDVCKYMALAFPPKFDGKLTTKVNIVDVCALGASHHMPNHFLASSDGVEEDNNGSEITDNATSIHQGCGSVVPRQFTPVATSSPTRFAEARISRPMKSVPRNLQEGTKEDGTGVAKFLVSAGETLHHDCDFGETPTKKSLPSVKERGRVSHTGGCSEEDQTKLFSVRKKVGLQSTPRGVTGHSSSKSRVRNSPPSALEMLSPSGRPYTSEEVLQFRNRSASSGGDLGQGSLTEFMANTRTSNCVKKQSTLKSRKGGRGGLGSVKKASGAPGGKVAKRGQVPTSGIASALSASKKRSGLSADQNRAKETLALGDNGKCRSVKRDVPVPDAELGKPRKRRKSETVKKSSGHDGSVVRTASKQGRNPAPVGIMKTKKVTVVTDTGVPVASAQSLVGLSGAFHLVVVGGAWGTCEFVCWRCDFSSNLTNVFGFLDCL